MSEILTNDSRMNVNKLSQTILSDFLGKLMLNQIIGAN